ncbi:MAG: N-acetylmuramoyl-L-alanine amidase [Micrococcales bacterium]|nr:N-acetylmuramoyl-L-alanine amidase [Micrococcales bacterium]
MKVGRSRRVVRGPATLVVLSVTLVGAACTPGPAGSTETSASATQAPATPAAEPSLSAPAPPDLPVHQDLREQFQHGPKPAEYQKYIVLHDTEGTASPPEVIASWAASDRMVAAHFVVGTDGQVWQAVPLDVIAHHVGYGDTGHNEVFGVPEDGRDDMRGTRPIGRWAADYGMNSYSVGIELVHVGGAGDYPQAQLEALDQVVAHVDGYYGFDSTIIDHKAWRSGNSDTSAEFAPYLEAYQEHRTYQSD